MQTWFYSAEVAEKSRSFFFLLFVLSNVVSQAVKRKCAFQKLKEAFTAFRERLPKEMGWAQPKTSG